MLAIGFGPTALGMILFTVLCMRTSYALPVAIHALPDERYDTGSEQLDGSAAQVSLNVSSALPPADPPALHTLKDLYDGNMKFRNHENSRQMRANATKSTSIHNQHFIYLYLRYISTFVHVSCMFGQSVCAAYIRNGDKLIRNITLFLVTAQKISSMHLSAPPYRIPILQTNTSLKTRARKTCWALISNHPSHANDATNFK